MIMSFESTRSSGTAAKSDLPAYLWNRRRGRRKCRSWQFITLTTLCTFYEILFMLSLSLLQTRPNRYTNQCYRRFFMPNSAYSKLVIIISSATPSGPTVAYSIFFR